MWYNTIQWPKERFDMCEDVDLDVGIVRVSMN